MTNGKKRRVPRRVGDVVEITLDSAGLMAYAVVLAEGAFAIFDGRTAPDADAAIRRPPMFYVAVIDGAVTTGRWPVVQTDVDLVPALKVPPTFMQDPLNREKFQVYERGMMRPASRAECLHLERTAVWDPEHVEDRIRDAYAGRENKWLRSMKIDAL